MINNFSGYGILIASADNTVQSCFIGTNAAGTAAGATPMPYGVVVTGAGNLIGGGTAGTGNVISGNASDGIVIGGMGATGNVVAGNLIGTSSSGTAPLGNGDVGILIQYGAADNWIGFNSVHGPSSASQGNVIAGNSPAGSPVPASLSRAPERRATSSPETSLA